MALLRWIPLALIAFTFLGCEDPFGYEREELELVVEVLQQECDNLRRITGPTSEMSLVVGRLSAKPADWAGKLDAIDGCGPCAERLRAIQPSALRPPEHMPKLDVGSPRGREYSLDRLREWAAVMSETRDRLRRVAEQRDEFERELGRLKEEVKGAVEHPDCAVEACRVVVDAQRSE
ncbi:MAG: hypothetical protein GY898_25825 [Proteobacteria bacterium]|nr:hypothetical protein [Pseudomonadota bacterium]